MILYISGPLEDASAFLEAEAALTLMGYVCVNPVRRGKAAGDDAADIPRSILAERIAALEKAEGLALLDGWQDSDCARLERKRMLMLARPVRTAEQWLDDPEMPRAIRWTGDPLCEPQRFHRGDAGYDLTVARKTTLYVGQFVDVDLGIRVELPEGVWAMLTGRSSTLRRRGVLVSQGIIDNGYRGPVFAGCQNLGERLVTLERGERIAQLIPIPLASAGIGVRRVTELSESDRGANAFGSTGAGTQANLDSQARVW